MSRTVQQADQPAPSAGYTGYALQASRDLARLWEAARAVVYGAVFLGERITPWMLICAVVIICGVALSTGLVEFGRRRVAP